MRGVEPLTSAVRRQRSTTELHPPGTQGYQPPGGTIAEVHNRELAALFDDLSTPPIVDACLRMGTELRAAAPENR